MKNYYLVLHKLNENGVSHVVTSTYLKQYFIDEDEDSSGYLWDWLKNAVKISNESIDIDGEK